MACFSQAPSILVHRGIWAPSTSCSLSARAPVGISSGRAGTRTIGSAIASYPQHGSSFSHPLHIFRYHKCKERGRRELIIRRTSADWWEDEEEFDAVAGEVLLPKTLYVLSLPSPQEAAGSAPTLEQDPQKQQGEAEEWLVEYSAEILKGHLENGKKATVGFTSSEVAGMAEGVWSAWGAAGPPYFKKVKRRDALDRMAKASGLEEAEALLKEIFSQNWRVELDAGLGVDLNPREHILIACTRPASNVLLEAMGFKGLGQSDGGVVLTRVQLDGWNTSDMKAEDLLPLEDWHNLNPKLMSRQYSHPPL